MGGCYQGQRPWQPPLLVCCLPRPGFTGLHVFCTPKQRHAGLQASHSSTPPGGSGSRQPHLPPGTIPQNQAASTPTTHAARPTSAKGASPPPPNSRKPLATVAAAEFPASQETDSGSLRYANWGILHKAGRGGGSSGPTKSRLLSDGPPRHSRQSHSWKARHPAAYFSQLQPASRILFAAHAPLPATQRYPQQTRRRSSRSASGSCRNLPTHPPTRWFHQLRLVPPPHTLQQAEGGQGGPSRA